MGLKPDHWIRKMAHEHRMIEPFVDKQVREGVISYGVSSYGYDIRVADEFMIFTNVHSAIVDPKNFDTKSMFEFKGDVCVIPPNSFALSRTVEYFRIPRKVLTICLGKCLTGDTRVVDAETGEYLSLDQFVKQKGKKVVSLNQWDLNVADVSDHIYQGMKPVFLLTTRLGLKIKATANHPFRTFSGWTPLEHLLPGDRIAVARSCPVFGKNEWPEHEATLLGLMLSDGQCHTPGHSPRFTNEDPAIVDALYDAAGQFGVSITPVGRFGYNLVNQKGRGGIVTRNRTYSWLESLGCNVGSEAKFIPSVVFTATRESVKKFLQALFSGDGSVYSSRGGKFLEYSSISEHLILDLHHLLLRFGVFSLIRNKKSASGKQVYWLQITDVEMIRRFAQEVGFIPRSKKQIILEEMVSSSPVRLRSNFDTLPSPAWAMMRQAVYSSGQSLRSVGILATQPDQSLPYKMARVAVGITRDEQFSALVDSDVVWDTVKSIEPVGEELVYDITVPEYNNFLANDIIVHNSTYARCGIIVNVTPFEPEWEGFVTLEISNTTPLPAKIYANEGLAQVLFFEADEECEISYADKKGKYQKQQSIVLPKL
jgi:deoxycytidine triphosphate deaminase